MDKALGILMLAGYITAVVGLASAITFAVIRIFPTERNPKKSDKPEKPSSGVSTGGGSLFRRSKREET
ncbi:MAG: hypothetical protein WD015_06300 [Gaiellaceae bacterium]